MSNHAVLFSVRPKFAEMIFAGTKTVELRRVCPKIHFGDLALVYVSSPTKQLQGAFEVGKIISASPSTLWKKVGSRSGLTRKEFIAYFKGKPIAHAIVIKHAWTLTIPVCLTTLRKTNGGFRPPQNFHYIKRTESPLLSLFLISQNN